MKHLKLLILGMAIACSATAGEAKDNVVYVAHPANDAQSNNYTNSRLPLRQPYMMKLPVGSIHPDGWVRRYLELQRDGLTGHLPEISEWLDKKNNAWLVDGAHNGWEEAPYWLKGYISLAYTLGDESMIAEAQSWIEGVLKRQRADGFFGSANFDNGKPELWAQMLMLESLITYYEHTGDQRVIDLMTRYLRWEATVPDSDFLKSYWENSRGGDNLYCVLWLYNRTGGDWLLDLARKIHRNTANWCQSTTLPNWHNVNIAQCFREPAIYWMLTNEDKFLRATYNDFTLVRRIYGQMPGGMFAADENCRQGYVDPRQAVETCGMVEQMASDEMLLRFTGDTYWAENCEDVAFNTYPAAVTADFRALRYLTASNMVQSDVTDHHPGIENAGPFLAMNPFSSRCCQHNHAMGWPYYSEHLVMATPDNGAVVALYAACSADIKVADGHAVRLVEETHYPFDDKITFWVKTDGKVSFPLYLRVPTWTQEEKLKINDKKMSIGNNRDKYIKIDREWQNGDKVELTLPMRLTMRQWQLNKNSVSINYGPLTLSLNIKERNVKRDSKAVAYSDSRWRPDVDASLWPTTEIFADSPWNYALYMPKGKISMKMVRRPWPSDNFPFTQQNSPIIFYAQGSRVPSWTLDEYSLCGVLPEETDAKSDILDDITLVPMGAARLRISAFPVTKE